MTEPLGIFTSLPEGKFLSVNKSLARMLGYDDPDQLTDAIRDIEHELYANPDDRARIKSILTARGEIHDFECQWVDRTGRLLWVSIHAGAIKNESGDIDFYQGFVADITERKKTEDEMEQLMAAVQQFTVTTDLISLSAF